MTRRGIDTAVAVSIDEWHKLKDETVDTEGCFLAKVRHSKFHSPKRGTVKSRKPAVFD